VRNVEFERVADVDLLYACNFWFLDVKEHVRERTINASRLDVVALLLDFEESESAVFDPFADHSDTTFHFRSPVPSWRGALHCNRVARSVACALDYDAVNVRVTRLCDRMSWG
jgi:hypothetical protein